MMRQNDASEKSGDGKKELTDEHDPHEIGHQASLGIGETSDEAGNWQGEDGDNESGGGENEKNGVESGIGKFVGLFGTLAKIFVVNGDESGREGADDQ